MDDLFGIGPMEILIILVVAVIALGPAKMVEVGRALGKLVGTLKKASADLTNQVAKELEEEKQSQPPPAPPASDKSNNTV